MARLHYLSSCFKWKVSVLRFFFTWASLSSTPPEFASSHKHPKDIWVRLKATLLMTLQILVSHYSDLSCLNSIDCAKYIVFWDSHLLTCIWVGDTNTRFSFQSCSQMLDENASLIKTISEYQNSGKHTETVQYQWNLHRNLMYLASIADSNQNLQNLLPVR